MEVPNVCEDEEGFLLINEVRPENQVHDQGAAAIVKFFLKWSARGYGLFCVAFILFTPGNALPLWMVVFSMCFPQMYSPSPAPFPPFPPPDDSYSCQMIAESITWVEIGGMITGMLIFAKLASWRGRRLVGRVTAVFMFIGSCLLTGAYMVWMLPRAMFLDIIVGELIFAWGAGGEYPNSAASAAEEAEASVGDRGMKLGFTFAMQAWGYLINCMVFYLSLRGCDDCGIPKLLWTCVIAYGIGAVLVFFFCYIDGTSRKSPKCGRHTRPKKREFLRID